MSIDKTTEVYDILVYLLSAFSGFIISLLAWILKAMKNNQEKITKCMTENSEDIRALQTDVMWLKSEIERRRSRRD